MGSLEAGHRLREHLPAIGFLGSRGTATSPAPLVSPTTMYPSQPLPFSYSSTPTSAGPGYVSSPGSRRAEEEKEKAPRQSLPSIHEALGNDNRLPYPAPPTSAPQQPNNAPPHHLPPNLASRPGEGPSGPPNPFSTGSSFLRESSISHQPQLQTEPSRSSLTSLNTQDSRNASLHSISSGKSPTQSASTGITSISGSQTGPAYDYNAPPSAGSVASPSGYGGFSQPYPFQSQPPPGAPVYPASYDSRPYVGRVDEVKNGIPGPFAGHPDSAKRHLDMYDMEASLNALNEMVDMSTRSMEFSRHYASKAHQARSGPVMGALPSMQEIEEMLNIQRRNHDALMRVRTAVFNQEHAMAEQMAQRKAFKLGGVHDDDRMAMYQEEFKGSGFVGPDSKKRRGKAAPPGRCHSCNRAETPEWRRGPDGARTLCNACGLHYAKLTRKMGAKQAAGLGSNLKPKTALDSVSPRSH
ncbi:GATA-type sexual development transcription factor NsdD [Aspergillus stella-maris]|uniref:GATA-type sexual development transcription factor NsdD n=1 Tax=Aspergillus stella-maris TaxID=1810926 RepID=UPI003CCDFC56